MFEGWVSKKERCPGRICTSLYDLLWLRFGNYTAFQHILCVKGVTKPMLPLLSRGGETDSVCWQKEVTGEVTRFQKSIWDWKNFGENFRRTQFTTAIVILSPATKWVAPNFCWKGQMSTIALQAQSYFRWKEDPWIQRHQVSAVSCFPTREWNVPPSSLKWFGL